MLILLPGVQFTAFLNGSDKTETQRFQLARYIHDGVSRISAPETKNVQQRPSGPEENKNSRFPGSGYSSVSEKIRPPPEVEK